MCKIKLGVIGVGNMGRTHCRNIKEGKCPEIELVAIADSNPNHIQAMKDEGYENVACFLDADEMMDIIYYSMEVFYNRKDHWKKLVKNGMNRDFSWDVSADKYISLYKELI